jgi:branched-subunit amino acid ABC-type transport system permease component
MKKTALADFILKKLLAAKHRPKLISTLAFEARASYEDTLAVLIEMNNIHPGWYIIQRRCKTDIEARLDHDYSSEIMEFMKNGGYAGSFAPGFRARRTRQPLFTNEQQAGSAKFRWLTLAAILVSLLFVLLTWYVITRGTVVPASITR